MYTKPIDIPGYHSFSSPAQKGPITRGVTTLIHKSLSKYAPQSKII